MIKASVKKCLKSNRNTKYSVQYHNPCSLVEFYVQYLKFIPVLSTTKMHTHCILHCKQWQVASIYKSSINCS